MRTLYVNFPSKKAINNVIMQGVDVVGDSYDLVGRWRISCAAWKDGDVIKVYRKTTSDGTPIAHAYGVVKRNRNGMVQVK